MHRRIFFGLSAVVTALLALSLIVGAQTSSPWDAIATPAMQTAVAGADTTSTARAATMMPTNTPLPPTATMTPAQRGFVAICAARSTTQMCANGAPWAAYGGTVYHIADTDAEIDSEVQHAQAVGLNTLQNVGIRCQWTAPSDMTSDCIMHRNDYALSKLRAAGMHYILDFSDYGHLLHDKAGVVPEDPAQYAGWDSMLSLYANHVNPYTGIAYKDDPTIAFTEIYGEADAPNGGDPLKPTTAELTAFFQHTMATWHSVAPSILGSSGNLQNLDWGGGVDYQAIFSDPNNAFCNSEIDNANERSVTGPLVRDYCTSIGKPWINGAVNVGGGLAASNSDGDIAAWTDALESWSVNTYRADGILHWNLGDDDHTTNPNSSDFGWPGTPQTNGVILKWACIATGVPTSCQSSATATPTPATSTAIPPTTTSIPPTSTTVAPTSTPIPATNTPVPPTSTATTTPIPTATAASSGLVPTGNDTAQIQAAINAGGTVRLGAGTFLIDPNIALKAGTTIVGAGKTSTTIKVKDNSGQWGYALGGSGNGIAISDLTLDLNEQHQGVASSTASQNENGIQVSGSGLQVRRVAVANVGGVWAVVAWGNSTVIDSSGFTFTRSTAAEDNSLVYLSGSGVAATNDTFTATVATGSGVGSRGGLEMHGSGTVSGSTFSKVSNGMNLTNGYGPTDVAGPLVVHDNTLNDVAIGISLWPTKRSDGSNPPMTGTHVYNNHVNVNWQAHANYGYEAAGISLYWSGEAVSQVTDVEIDHNTVTFNTASASFAHDPANVGGISVTNAGGAARVNIHDNTITGATYAGVMVGALHNYIASQTGFQAHYDSVQIVNNTINDPGYDTATNAKYRSGIYVSGVVSNFTISGNTVTHAAGVTQYGIYYDHDSGSSFTNTTPGTNTLNGLPSST